MSKPDATDADRVVLRTSNANAIRLSNLRIFLHKVESAIQTNRDSGQTWVDRRDLQLLREFEKQLTAPETFCDEPKPPEALNAGRYAERLWGYKDQVGSYSEMGRVYEKDRADFWQARFNEATAQKAAAETLRVGASDWEEFGLAVRTVSQNCDMTDLARRGDWLQRELKARGFDIVRSSQKASEQQK